MALRAGYKGIKKYIADMLNAMSPGDGIATDKEVSDAFDEVVGWNQDDEHASVETLLNGKVDNSVIGPVEDGEKASQSYAVGEHFIKDGKFCTVIQSIAAEATLTENTNYTSGDVASLLTMETGTVTTTDEKVTIASGVNYVYKYGKVVNFRVRFTLAADISSSENVIKLPYNSIFTGNMVLLRPQDNISGNAQYAYLTSSGNVSITSLTAGSYEFTGTYICQ